MEHILVSACLLGENCKWDGGSNRNEKVLDFVKDMEGLAEFHMVCPEQMGGLPTPRPASEIVAGNGRVVNTEGADVTAEFEHGAELALRVAREHGCTCALLKERSPSCGCHGVYDGSFSKTLTDGMGKAAGLLAENGIRVFGETELDALRDALAMRSREAEDSQAKICEEIIRRHVALVPKTTSYRYVFRAPRFYVRPLAEELSQEAIETVREAMLRDRSADVQSILAVYTPGPLVKEHCRQGMVLTDRTFVYCDMTKGEKKEFRADYREIRKVEYKYRWLSERRTIRLQMTDGREVELDSEGAKYMVEMLSELIVRAEDR